MKPLNFLALITLLLLGGCRYFSSNFYRDNRWSYFEEWDTDANMHIDKQEFMAGCVRDGFVKKDEQATADSLFNAADQTKDSELTGIEFYRWKVGYVDQVNLSLSTPSSLSRKM